MPVDVGAHQWKHTTTYLVHEWEGPSENGTPVDPAEALYELASGAFGTPASDISRLRQTDLILIAPGPALDTLTGLTMSLIERVLALRPTLIGLEPTEETRGLRIRPEIRREQTLRLLAIPGIAEVEYLA